MFGEKKCVFSFVTLHVNATLNPRKFFFEVELQSTNAFQSLLSESFWTFDHLEASSQLRLRLDWGFLWDFHNQWSASSHKAWRRVRLKVIVNHFTPTPETHYLLLLSVLTHVNLIKHLRQLCQVKPSTAISIFSSRTKRWRRAEGLKQGLWQIRKNLCCSVLQAIRRSIKAIVSCVAVSLRGLFSVVRGRKVPWNQVDTVEVREIGFGKDWEVY